jgi:hypothetical protein
MNDMYEKSEDLKKSIYAMGKSLRVTGEGSWGDYAQRVSRAAADLAARAEVLEREYATVRRIISAIESRAKAEEVQVLQGAIQPDPTDAGSVQPSVCETASRG